MKIVIEEVQATDWERLRELRLRAVTDSPKAFSDSVLEIKSKPKEFWIEGISRGHVFVAKFDDEWVGMAVFIKDSNGEWSVKSLWVDPKHRGKGIGGEFIKTIIETARKDELNGIRLDVNTESEEIINFYKSFGFEITNTIENKQRSDGTSGSLYTMFLTF